jgi:Tfp pilus assembly protein FimT
MQGARGLTFLELLVVLGIAALSIAIVGVRSEALFGRARYHAAVRDIAAALNTAKSAALLQGRDVVLHYDASARTLYWGEEAAQRLVLPDVVAVRIDRAVRNEPAGNDGVPPLFVFRSDGTARGDASLTVTWGEAGVTFRVNWALGTIERQDASGPA